MNEIDKISYWENKIKNGDFKSSISFITSIPDMPLHELRTEFSDDIDHYQVLFLDINKVARHLEHGSEERFPQDALSIDCRTPRLLELIESNVKIIPPEIIYINNGRWTIKDGQHRFSIMRYLKLGQAPFLIRKSHIIYSEELK